MRIVRKLKILPGEFFDKIEESIAVQLIRAGLEPAEFQGLQSGAVFVLYPDEQYRRTEIEILAYEEDRCLRMLSKTFADEVESSYEVEPAEHGIQVVFTQESKSFRQSQKRGVFRHFSEALALSHMSESLLDIQNRVLDDREGIAKRPEPVQRRRSLLEKLISKEG